MGLVFFLICKETSFFNGIYAKRGYMCHYPHLQVIYFHCPMTRILSFWSMVTMHVCEKKNMHLVNSYGVGLLKDKNFLQREFALWKFWDCWFCLVGLVFLMPDGVCRMLEVKKCVAMVMDIFWSNLQYYEQKIVWINLGYIKVEPDAATKLWFGGVIFVNRCD